MNRWMPALILAVSALLVGCANPAIHSNVTVFENWPNDLRGQSFVFERTKEQDGNLEYLAYENLVRAELQRLGFAEAAMTQTPKLKVSLNYNMNARDVREVLPVVVDPFWAPYPFYYSRWHGRYWPYYDPFFYGPPVVQYRDISYTLYKRQLRTVISQAADSRKLYDVRVDSEGRNGSLAAVMPYMVRSAFAGFPGKNGETRHVELEMKE